ncbi:hypothetical protein CASFOL_042679 [Castilleja foliolosa]|uniref:MADS-box domain-containing protein n=1 Tax=Castilleja foliolosa TaxID=1961234 RepID=A0ABD3B7U6_9LAMI
MGRKIDMKKIEDITRCQVTFSKRRSSVIKKANEIAICCDVDVAFVAFSPSGRISKFCNQKRIEDVLHRFVDLPAEIRLNHISNVQQKMEKLRQLDHINGDNSKLQYLDKQIENLELQIKKSGLELQILETDLRDYELGPEQEPSLHQLSWCEKNLNHSLEKVINTKNALIGKSSTSYNQKDFKQTSQTKLENRGEMPISSEFVENERIPMVENPFAGQTLMQFDPWTSPYKVQESIFQEVFDQAKYTSNVKLGLSNIPKLSSPCNFPILDSQNIFEPQTTLTPRAQIQSFHNPIDQSLMVDQSLLNFHQQNNVDVWNNNSSVFNFSDSNHKSTQSSCNIPAPSMFTSTTTMATNGIGSNLNLNHIERHEISQLNNIGKTKVDSVDYDDRCRIETQSRAPFYPPADQQKEVFQDTKYDHFLHQDTLEEETMSTSEVPASSLWDWDDLLLDGNINLQDIFSEK